MGESEEGSHVMKLQKCSTCQRRVDVFFLFLFAPCNVVKGIVGQTIDKPQVENRVAAHGDRSPSHRQCTLLRGRPKSWKPLRH